MIDKFNGEYRWLSNFYPAVILYKGDVFPTSEHAYQAMKTFHPEEYEQIRAASTPGKAKRLGSRVTLRPDWDNVKLGLMLEIVTAKFREHPELAEKLLATGDEELIEGNTWNDTFWGVCDGKGKNYLGRILMLIREELR